MQGTLYVVATPIGNLEDLTRRAGRMLGEVSLIAAEDTRQTRKLLARLGLSTRMVSYNAHNAGRRGTAILEALRSGDVALVTDAGAPGVSDPGAQLVAEAWDAGFRVAVVPGPSAATAALSVSGMPGDAFHFLGFLPRAGKARREALGRAAAHRETLVIFEAPHRLRASLGDMLAVLGDRRIAVCRELTKLHEEVFRGVVSEALEHFASPRGEFALVVEGAGRPPASEEPDDARIAAAMAAARGQGLSRSAAAASVASALGASRRRVYGASEGGGGVLRVEGGSDSEGRASGEGGSDSEGRASGEGGREA